MMREGNKKVPWREQDSGGNRGVSGTPSDLTGPQKRLWEQKGDANRGNRKKGRRVCQRKTLVGVKTERKCEIPSLDEY